MNTAIMFCLYHNEIRIPEHVAVIPDGNRRYLKKCFTKDEDIQHSLQRLIDWSLSTQIKKLSIFGWSSENWSRPTSEVQDAMKQFNILLDKWLICDEERISYVFISSSPEKLSDEIRMKMSELTEKTKENNEMIVFLYVSYGFSEELRMNKRVSPSFSPDLLIRTSGEYRLSNFCMANLCYTELLFIDPLFPECDEEVWDSCLEKYSTRQRRFGK